MKTNFSETSLLLGVDILCELDSGKLVTIKIPTLGDTYGSLTMDRFFNLLHTDVEQMSEVLATTQFEAETLQDMFIGIMFHEYEVDLINDNLAKIIPGASLTKSGIAVDEEVLEPEDLQYIANIVLVGVGIITMQEFHKRETLLGETEIDRIQRENQEKIDRIRAGKKADGIAEKNGKTISMEQAFGNIVLLLPGITLDYIRGLNQFSFQWLSNYAQGLINDRLMVSAAGMVGLKDYKFITEKVKR